MYVRDAKNRDEVWLLDHIEEMALDDAAFRSRDYVIAVDEETNERAGFGRIRIHKTDDGDICELTGVGVLPAWRGQGVGAHVVERLIETATAEGFETVYSLTDEPGYLTQFGFDPVESSDLPPKMQERLATKQETIQPDSVATSIAVDDFTMPARLREAFKDASPHDPTDESAVEDAEDFGIDPDSATYKYDTGR
ncbi:GNAT family N-acetyltransferase [Haloplanus aerogenes]|uniref:GNAT family N-acetyltransferase n=1 Tax=Haloplanus aerogenes TaxID=660522 RepID=A0A3M0DUL0_9EURY|nr:GNAT family N-acetyltransferase [Haloplanus aerogenes]AZH25828.1 GNAT family N-acetyltransferase [Haloplanus aerogenes]RMB25572.1 N-acetylglutamate synthase-like GNAT family acetyltransferase [Haloplanus aerogenes]